MRRILQLISFGRWLKKIDENIARIVRWAAFFGLVSAAMSWVANYITPLHQYGWGAAVFAGVGAACVITLVASGTLVAWRYFNPLPERPVALSQGQEAPLDDVLNRVAETERGIAQNKASLDELRTEVAMLSMSLRARDAESIIKEADQVIVFTAKKLLEGSYPDEAAWADDYAIWEKAMSRIDNLMPRWAQQHHKPFLDIRLKDFEAGAPPPQQSNIKSDTNVMRYKTVWLAQQSYANRREDILQFFASKAGELPGWKGEDF
jgi:hypothetical protein